MQSPSRQPKGVEVIAPMTGRFSEILSAGALDFLAELHRRFEPIRQQRLQARTQCQRALDAGSKPDFLPETAAIRAGDWKIAPLPLELADRRVEITGPAGDRKMVINALNSGAKVFMADFEDSLAPTWENLIEGQINLRDAVRRSIRFTSPEGKEYRLQDKPAILFVRPRGWHLHDKHIVVDGEFISASLMDFGLYIFHNAQSLLAQGSGPYFYLPKMESHLEARLWNSIFEFAEAHLGITRGSIKATVLIETILAAFEMDEMLYELREHSAGLNCGRWDYIFSVIKKFHNDPNFIIGDRALVTMDIPFMRAYSLLTIKTCHRRGAHAMGGMAAQIPIKEDAAANTAALDKVRADKEREASDGHDGTWVAHPGLVPLALAVFDQLMPAPNQIARQRDDVSASAADLLAFAPKGPITEHGLRTNIEVAIEYMGAWLAGYGAVPIHHLMEDAATAEIARAQVWHWIRSTQGQLEDGRKITQALVCAMIPEALAHVRQTLGEARFAQGRYGLAAELFDALTVQEQFEDFLTTYCYRYLN
ncbi:MAG: malate synthase A [Burkholderiales bacterium]|nr:malate synthase A [Burkholderiales bacterium]